MINSNQRDAFWRGPPDAVYAWAAIRRDGTLMPNSVRERPKDVITACGDCVPLRVLVMYVPEDEIVPTPERKPDWILVYRRTRVPLFWIASDGTRRAIDDPPPRCEWSVEMSGSVE